MKGYPAELYHLLLDHDGDHLFDDVVAPWLDAATAHRAWLAAFALRSGRPVPPATREDLWTLYACSRLSDVLGAGALGPRISPDEHRRFMTTLGFSPIPEGPFTPFLHEIVEVEQSPDADEPVSLAGPEVWSGWMLGPMLFARAGVRVRAGRRHVVKEIAERSTIYWTFARKNRPASDLSHGWGHNSQWRTAFRRDYLVDGVARYNVDARAGRSLKDDGFTDDEVDELVRHRCFVRCPKPSDDLWPYDDGLVEPLTA